MFDQMSLAARPDDVIDEVTASSTGEFIEYLEENDDRVIEMSEPFSGGRKIVFESSGKIVVIDLGADGVAAGTIADDMELRRDGEEDTFPVYDEDSVFKESDGRTIHDLLEEAIGE